MSGVAALSRIPRPGDRFTPTAAWTIASLSVTARRLEFEFTSRWGEDEPRIPQRGINFAKRVCADNRAIERNGKM